MDLAQDSATGSGDDFEIVPGIHVLGPGAFEGPIFIRMETMLLKWSGYRVVLGFNQVNRLHGYIQKQKRIGAIYNDS